MIQDSGTEYGDFQKRLQAQLSPLFLRYSSWAWDTGINQTRWDQVREARRVLWFYKGVQYLAETMTRQGPNWVPVNDEAVMHAAGLQERSPAILAYTMNFLTGDVDLVASILARISPRAKPVAHDVRQKLPVPLQEAIERILAHFDGQYNRTDVKLPIARWFAMLPGAVFSHVQAVADAGKYGISEEPTLEEVEEQTEGAVLCTACGTYSPGQHEFCPVPSCGALILEENVQAPEVRKVQKPGQPKRVPNIGFEVRWSNLLNTWITPDAKDLEEATWLVHEEQLPLGRLLQRYDVERSMLASPVYSGWTSRSYNFVDLQGIRAIAASSTGQAIPNLYNRYSVLRMWLDPSEYELIEDEQTRRELYTYFPNGIRTSWLRATATSNNLIEAVPENFRDCWAMKTHDAQPPDATPSHFRPYMDAQTAINDLLNIAIMTAMASGGLTMVPNNLIDTQLMATLRRFPGSVVGMGPDFDRTKIHTIDGAQLDGAILNFIEMLLRMGRQAVNITDSVRGSSATGVAREAVINREQSLQAFQPKYKQLLELFKETATNYIKQMARFRMSRIWVPKSAGAAPSFVEIQDLGKLLEVGWRLDVDETLPLTPADQRTALLDSLPKLAQIPAIAEVAGFADPLNAQRVLDMIGIPDFFSRTASMVRAIRGVFESIVAQPVPEGFDEVPQDPEALDQWREETRMLVDNEPLIVEPNNDHIPLAAVADLGSTILNFTEEFRALYRSKHYAWLRCDKYVKAAKEQLAAMAPPPGAPPSGGAPGAGGPPGDVPNGDSLPPEIPAAPLQGLPAMSQ